MRVSFATTNPIKVDSVVRVLEGRGIDIEVVGMEIPEIQADKAVEVAIEKANCAFRRLGRPVLVNDFGIHLEALDGFPGTNVKYVTRTIGLEGYFRLLRTLDGHLGHGCTLVSALAYMDASLDAPKTFERVTSGLISPDAHARLPSKPKGKQLVMDVFVPDGEVVSIGQMTKSHFDAWRRRPAHEAYYHELADWLLARAV